MDKGRVFMSKCCLAIFVALILEVSMLPVLTASAEWRCLVPDSNTRRLTQAELWSHDRETLRYIRNEILVRHGYVFTMDKYRDYFMAQPWDTPSVNYKPGLLSSLERDNISTIKDVEAAMDGEKR